MNHLKWYWSHSHEYTASKFLQHIIDNGFNHSVEKSEEAVELSNFLEKLTICGDFIYDPFMIKMYASSADKPIIIVELVKKDMNCRVKFYSSRRIYLCTRFGPGHTYYNTLDDMTLNAIIKHLKVDINI